MKKHSILTLVLMAFIFTTKCKEEQNKEERIKHFDVKNEPTMSQFMKLDSEIQIYPLGTSHNNLIMRHSLHSFEGEQSVSFPPPYGHPCGEKYYSGSWEYRDGVIHVKIDRAKSEEDCSLEHIEYLIDDFTCAIENTGCSGEVHVPELGGKTGIEIHIWDYAPRSK